MSIFDPIEVPEDLPERHVHELLRLEEADSRHGQEHKTNPQLGMDPCWVCKAYRNAMRAIADGGTSEMIEMIEKVAFKLAMQTAGDLGDVPADQYWELVLTERVRQDYRRKAHEILQLLDLNPAILPSGARVSN